MDSTTNEPASHGFVKYNIYPAENVTPGDIIENEAQIYFDFNQAIATEIVYHEISDNLLSSIVLQSIKENDIEILVFPNPVSSEASIKFAQDQLPGELNFAIYSLDGTMVLQQSIHASDRISCEAIPNGIYIIRFIIKNQFLGQSKFVVMSSQ